MDEMQDPITPSNGQGSDAGAGAGDPVMDATGGAGASDPDSTTDSSFAWSDDPAASGDSKAAGERMLGQLQGMIDTVATQATPMARQIGIKAAELAATAADRAGPFAHRAADATADATLKFAERSRLWAAELRNKTTESNGAGDDAASTGSSVAIADPEDAPTDAASDAG